MSESMKWVVTEVGSAVCVEQPVVLLISVQPIQTTVFFTVIFSCHVCSS
jgi:hypothetical protein